MNAPDELVSDRLIHLIMSTLGIGALDAIKAVAWIRSGQNHIASMSEPVSVAHGPDGHVNVMVAMTGGNTRVVRVSSLTVQLLDSPIASLTKEQRNKIPMLRSWIDTTAPPLKPKPIQFVPIEGTKWQTTASKPTMKSVQKRKQKEPAPIVGPTQRRVLLPED